MGEAKLGHDGVDAALEPRSPSRPHFCEPSLAWQAMREVVDAARRLEPQVGAIIITGEGKAFAAGADIKELAQLSYEQVA